QAVLRKAARPRSRATRRRTTKSAPSDRTTKPSPERRARLIEIGASLPDVEVAVIGRRKEHRSFLVRKKIFAYYLEDHHGDGKVALWCKAGPGEQGRLREQDPRRFFIPA